MKGNSSNTNKENIDNNDSKDNLPKRRVATTAEKRFERFIKNRVKGMLNDEYVELVDYIHYKNSIGVILDVINEYKYKEQIEDIFEDKYVIQVSMDLINKLLEKEKEENSVEEQETTIILSFMSILENHIINNSEETKDYKVELQNKEILKKLNQLFDIRENYEELLKYAIVNVDGKFINLDYNYYRNYIDSLFGYKTKTQLLEIIRSKFDNNAEINTDNNDVIIKFNTLDIVKYFRLDPLTIKEIRNHYNLQSLKLNSIKIIINNIKDDYSSSANPIKQITYDIEQSGTYIKTMVYQNGNTIVSKPEKI